MAHYQVDHYLNTHMRRPITDQLMPHSPFRDDNFLMSSSSDALRADISKVINEHVQDTASKIAILINIDEAVEDCLEQHGM